VAEADIVFINGLGFEGWIERLIESAGYKGKTIVAAKGIKPISSPEAGGERASSQIDPHAWHSIANVIGYVRVIENALAALDPLSARMYRSQAAAFVKQLKALDQTIHQQIKNLHPQQRRVITAHDAFQYFGRDYGIKFRAPLGVTTESEPTPQAIAQLIEDIRTSHIRAVFIENLANARIIEQISKDAGVQIEGMLYSDALSEAEGPAATYVAMMNYNARMLVNAMEKNPAQ
jgi:zinc/manganese transport system substrate-binding protein